MSLREDTEPGENPAAEQEHGHDAGPRRPAAAAARTGAQTGQPSPPAEGKAGRRRLVLPLVALAILSGGSYAGWSYWTNGRFLVSTDDAYVQADISILAAKVPGYLAAVPVKNGQEVRRGEVIARLEDGDYRLALQAARDKLATQRSTITRIARQVEAAEAQVAQSTAQIDAAQADSLRAGNDFARASQMQADFVAKSRLDQARADRDRTEAAVRGARAAALAARANVEVLSAQKAEAESLARELATAVDRAQRDLDFAVIRAPVDGVVGNKAVEAGAYVQPGSRIAALVPLASVRVDANFKETQVQRMRIGQSVHVRVDAYPDRDIIGTVETFSPASGSVFSLLPPDNATGNFTKIVQRLPVRIRVPEELAREGLLRPGLSVVVSVDTREPGPLRVAPDPVQPEMPAATSAIAPPTAAPAQPSEPAAAPAPEPRRSAAHHPAAHR